MRLSLVALLIGLEIVFSARSPGLAAEDARKIPLDSVYTTTRQNDTKDALAQLKDLPQPLWEMPIPPEPVIFLVNGKDFPTAVKASRPFLQPQADPKAPGPKAETKAGEQNWVGAHLGVKGSRPPAYRVLSVEVEGTKVRVKYESIKEGGTTLDYYSYLVWAPLGKLPAGEYTLELSDAAARKVIVARKSKVVE